MTRCANCKSEMERGQGICRICGLDASSGQMARPTTHYHGRTSAMREARDRAYVESLVRAEYRKPMLMIIVGIIGSCLLALLDSGLAGVLAYGLGYFLHLPLGLAVFWILSVAWIGVSAPWHLTIMRLAGIYAVVDLIGGLLGLLPGGLGLIGWVVSVVVYIGLLMDLLELELPEAVATAVLTFVVKVFLVVSVVFYLMGP